MLNQVMMASNNERAMVRRAALSVGVNIVLTILLAPRHGALGIAWSAVLTRALNLGLDAQFVTKNVMHVSPVQTVAKPFLCTAFTGVVTLALRDQGLYALLFVTATSYGVLLLIFKVFSPGELAVLRQLSGRLMRRVVVWK